MLWGLLVIVALLCISCSTSLWVQLGRSPKGERLQRCEASPQWNGERFVNSEPTKQLTKKKNMFAVLWNKLTDDKEAVSPQKPLPFVRTDLSKLPKDEDFVVWLGHSSVFFQIDSVRFLVDPVLTDALPVNLVLKSFKHEDNYTTEDIPEVDYLIITHNHWDHLDCKTVKRLKDRVEKVVCALGVGESLEYWGYDKDKVVDLDWGEEIVINDSMKLHALPARHFSGRAFDQNKTLWASFLLEGKRTVYLSGDGGYGKHFEQIGERFPDIDLAIMENGQYDDAWRYIHTLPAQLPTAIEELGAERVICCHNSKYALANHPWSEPMEKIYENSLGKDWTLLVPRIGEVVFLDRNQRFEKWW